MEKPFDVTATVMMPDGSKTELSFNLFDVKREFPCPICASIGDDEKISVQSWSDHFARHYVENNRAGEINRAITEDMKTPIVVKGLRNDVAKYDHAVSSRNYDRNYDRDDYDRNYDRDDYDNAVNRVVMERHSRTYDQYGGGMSEEQMLQLAMEESLRESEAEAALAKTDLQHQASPVRIEKVVPPTEFKLDDSNYIPLVDAVLVNTQSNPTNEKSAYGKNLSPQISSLPALIPIVTPFATPVVVSTGATVTTPAVAPNVTSSNLPAPPAAYPVRKKKVL